MFCFCVLIRSVSTALLISPPIWPAPLLQAIQCSMEAADRIGFVVEHLENGVQLRDLQQVFHSF